MSALASLRAALWHRGTSNCPGSGAGQSRADSYAAEDAAPRSSAASALRGARGRAALGDERAALFAAALVCVLVLGCSTTASAQAAAVTVAAGGEGAGEVRAPAGVAVDQSSGELYVADANNFRILKFGADGSFLLGWGWGVADGTSQEVQTCGPEATPPTSRCFKGVGAFPAGAPGAVAPQAVAVDQGSGALYVVDAKRRVSKFTAAGDFIFTVGKEVNTTEETNICTVGDLEQGDECGAGLEGAGPNEFTAPLSLAVEPDGDVWVGDTDRLQELKPDGNPGAALALPGCGPAKALALDPAGNFYVKCQSLAGVRKLEAGTGALLGTLDAAGTPDALTVDGAGRVFIGDCVASGFACLSYRLMVFDPAGDLVSVFGAGQVIGLPGHGNGVPGNALALDEGAQALYVASSSSGVAESAVQRFEIPEPGPLVEGQRAEEVLPTTATLKAELNPEGNETSYHFEFGTSESYGQSTPEETLPGTGFEEETVEAGLEGLIPETTYHFRLVATNHCNPSEPAEVCTAEGPDTTFATRPAVGIEAQWASAVAARSATLHGELDPLGVEGKWWIEYGTSEALGSATEESVLPAQFGALALSTAFTGLSPATTYFYRFATSDIRDGLPYLVHGETQSFTTQLGGLGFELPDDRAWEMVSPPNKFGANIVSPDPAVGGQFQAAAGGEALAYLSRGSIEAEPEGNRGIDLSSALARREPGGSWSSEDITPPHTSVTPFSVGTGLEYKLFSPELERALLEPRDGTLLSPDATERTPYLRENTEPPGYRPLVTGKEGFANVPEGTKFGGDPTLNEGGVRVVSASADLEHAVLKSGVALVEGAPKGALYEWSAGLAPAEQLRAVSALPGGEVVAGDPGSGAGSVRHAISEDGSRVFWTALSSKGLYLRDTALEQTARLDAVQPGGFGTGAVEPRFQGADAQGSAAFFTTPQQLSADASEEGADLYRCEVEVEAGTLGCELSNLTGQGAGESASVLGLVAGMSDDGTHVYFVARGALDGEPNSEGESADPGEPNLYLWHEGEEIRFVATLSADDENDWGAPGLGTPPVSFNQSAAASPGGRYLAFMSSRSLTGYDNREAGSGEPAQEVFRYDAGEEELVCVSCNPAGGRPEALHGDELSEEFDPQNMWSGEAVAAVLPQATKVEVGGVSLYRPRAVHDNGRVFFNAVDALVPADSNGDGDVYQYEPLNTGSCSASSGDAGTARIEGGCVSLISAGVGAGTASFLDASEGGNDVFFYSPAQLSVTDEDNVTDIYDARVGGIAATLPLSAECQGEACQPAAVLPDAQTPASTVFRGPGNLSPKTGPKRCPKGKRKLTRKGKARCVARGHHRKQRRAAHKRRAGR